MSALQGGAPLADLTTAPLKGLRVVDLAPPGDTSLCGVLLAGLGAEIVRVDRSADAEAVLELAAGADVLVESPADARGPGPERCLARNPRLVHGRTTLAARGPDEPAAALHLAVAVLAALAQVARTGEGGIVDDTLVGCPFHADYRTADGHRMAVRALEPDGYRELVRLLDVWEMVPDHRDPSVWAELRRLFAGVFRTRTRQEWCEVFDGTDVCVSPVPSSE
ncbi:CoA transferase [Streptomyces sp. 4N124]|uniref:CoA transferase n=1 Tax=Streptomyces sp. 4N124 TaxID=3457420 RepID=UPI003FD36D3A